MGPNCSPSKIGDVPWTYTERHPRLRRSRPAHRPAGTQRDAHRLQTATMTRTSSARSATSAPMPAGLGNSPTPTTGPGGASAWAGAWLYGRTTAAGSESYLTDVLGSVLQLAGADQSARVDYTYGLYGQTLESPPGGSTNLIRYTAREQDTASLYYYRHRYYSPLTGRFLSEDPVGLAGGINLYGYVGGNPISRIDPSGEGWKEVVQAIGIAIGLAGTPGIVPRQTARSIASTPADTSRPWKGSGKAVARPGAKSGTDTRLASSGGANSRSTA